MIATHLPTPPPPFLGGGPLWVAGAGREVAGEGFDAGVECWRAAGVDARPGPGEGAGRAAGAMGTDLGPAGAGAGGFTVDGFGAGAGAGAGAGRAVVPEEAPLEAVVAAAAGCFP